MTTTSRFLVRLALLAIALAGIASSAFASVNYVQDIALPAFLSSGPILSTSQSPYTVSGSDQVPEAFTSTLYAEPDLSTATFAAPNYYAGYIVTQNSLLAWVQSSTDVEQVTITSRTITVASITSGTYLPTVILRTHFSVGYSLAVRSIDDPVSFIADTMHYSVDATDGTMTARPLSGLNTATAHYMDYGTDGLLYVLDYSNNRIASFDPDNAFAPVSSFNLETGVTTADEQFAVGVNGSFYLADGLGGGSYYNSAGVYQGTFSTDTTGDLGYTGASFINTDASGDVLVYDSATGLHQYQDTSVVPEPSTWILLLMAGALSPLFLRRRVA